MAQKNRELSQFSSFLEIDNSNQNIGIATTTLPYVGIGTTNPTSKLHVVGDTNVSGIISATGYYLNGTPLVSAGLELWEVNGSNTYRSTGNVGIGSSIPESKLTVVGNISVTGAITATGSITGSSVSISGNVSAGQFISTITSGTAPLVVSSTSQVFNLNASLLAGKSPPSGDIVGTTDTQSLTNKTLTSPTISSILNGGTLTLPTGTGTLIRTGSVGLVTSGMITGLSLTNVDIASNAGIVYSKLNLSNSITAADIVVGAGITYGKLSLSNSITNTDIATGAGISVSKLSANTISGITLGNNLATLTFGTYLTGASYNGSTATTLGINASTSGDSNIVARDGSGNFSAGTITCADLNSTSDINLKENVQTVDNALETISALRGVSFDWKETGRGSYGVIAQELEKVLPDLVNTGEVKSVNYSGLIGVLIEAVKELSKEIEELKSTK
jgi:hypothetical protein